MGMNNLLLFTIRSFLVPMIVYLLLTLVKQMDKNHGLPLKENTLYLFMCMVVGIVVQIVSGKIAVISIICMIGLLTISYTDYYTKKIYNFMNIILELFGVLSLLMLQIVGIKEWLIYTSVCSVAIFLCWKIRAIGTGDVMLLIALLPYLLILATNTNISGYLVVYFFVGVSLLLNIIMNLKKIIVGGVKQKIAYAPSVASTYMILIIAIYLKNGGFYG